MKPVTGARARGWRVPLDTLEAVERARREIATSQQAVRTAKSNLDAARDNLEDAKRIAAKARPLQRP